MYKDYDSMQSDKAITGRDHVIYRGWVQGEQSTDVIVSMQGCDHSRRITLQYQAPKW